MEGRAVLMPGVKRALLTGLYRGVIIWACVSWALLMLLRFGPDVIYV